ncbi:riboflavin synthase [Sandaracinus amylolyticus]|uniref:Riboflavin synthase n=1 Tax=Sandaracinus amylolyticus TaxID=927083 RepID=A0A0F6SFH1_9BACT|nr:riboflavin synthase [Sandaracinus amylolyticus]AKF06934.1 Riboflavin synthase eubacterial/eukaryotic [Sandaracinus amylolyticus]
MFTGLVEEIGTVRDVQRGALGSTMRIECPWRDLVLGESIAVNGVCLSVTTMPEGGFTCDASAETLEKTTLGAITRGTKVHLERALRAGDRFGGHVVSGHVDGVGKVAAKTPLGDALKVEFEVPEVLARFLAPKGSITVDGVSLTVNGATGTRFDVVLVPITREKTLLDQKDVGAPINLEVDVLAKYVARLLGNPGVDGVPPQNPPGAGGGGVTLDLLGRTGFL